MVEDNSLFLESKITQTTITHSNNLFSYKGFQFINSINPFNPKRSVSIEESVI